jgi:hypothetical protein
MHCFVIKLGSPSTFNYLYWIPSFLFKYIFFNLIYIHKLEKFFKRKKKNLRKKFKNLIKIKIKIYQKN